MEDKRLLIDTNIFIQHLRAKNKTATYLYQIVHKFEIYTSSITEFELYCGAISYEHKQDIDNVLKGIKILAFEEGCGELAASERNRLIRLNKQFEIRDLLIVGIILKNNLPFFTLNPKHFKNFQGISLITKDGILSDNWDSA